MSRVRAMLLGVAAFAATALPFGSTSARAAFVQSCSPTEAGLDSTHANFAALAFSGRSIAQVFLAKDTVITAITVWRDAANVAYGAHMHLFICSVDATLKPLPATGVLLDGPSVIPTVSDSVFAPLRYELSPPFALPGAGHYAFAIKEEDSNCNLAFTLLGDSTNAFADGDGWIVHPFVDCHALGSNCTALGSTPADLIFKVEFCGAGTPAIQETWGRVKAQYR